ncbi:hypothetical protein OS493_024966 [Desmophyllum pertusum]|uniref:Uncharacterized protein n=1 Tax=Desmophyllum pertusum TaxID=174260 RepID=A0A9X0CJL2_9CNID|nr:hypothetical protein OS493_024966 [Desmophyllum pertusum]
MDIPLPFIAAAADFMNMRVVRTLFRNSGAFFMRRSFMSDPLYWVVFTEYIQNQLQLGLIKSRSVLTEDYGSIHVHLGELIPLSRFTEGKINRAETASVPRHLFSFFCPRGEEGGQVSWLQGPL